MKISVLMTTYNQEEYISQALDSILMQEVDFDYEIVIGEDASTDRTQEIVLDYHDRYPDKVHVFLRDGVEAERDRARGIGGKTNFLRTWEACRGQYIALLDGDDYWTSPHKLQKQVDFFDEHPEYSISCHRVVIEREDASREPEFFPMDPQKQTATLEDFLTQNFIVACSVVLRRDLVDEFPRWFRETAIGDWSLYVLHAQRGKIGYMNDAMSAYRIKADGFWSGKTQEQQTLALVRFYERVNKHLQLRYNKVIGPKIFAGWNDLISLALRSGDFKKARDYGVAYLKVRPFQSHLFAKFKLFLRLYAPSIHKLGQKVRSSIHSILRRRLLER
jgi:glycosyltransferase involved in cell wall biosynthesis